MMADQGRAGTQESISLQESSRDWRSGIETIELGEDEELVTRPDGTQAIIKHRRKTRLSKMTDGVNEYIDGAADGSIIWLGRKAVEWVGIAVEAMRGLAVNMRQNDEDTGDELR